MEGPDEVLASPEVHACLAANGRIDLGEKGCWNLYVVDAAHINGGKKSSRVTDDSAAKRDQEAAAVGTGLAELRGEPFNDGQALGALSLGKK